MKIFELYNSTPTNKIEKYEKRLNSCLNVKTDYEKIECNFEWIDLMEETIIYIDNILRNPNRFIVNEEEIVKVELARRITVESIKHLSRNTNLIQDYNVKTGDVRPSKILNINKDESYNTYENRFIYTLINNMVNYLNLKKSNLLSSSSLKDYKSLNYSSSSSLGNEKINVNINVDSKLAYKSEDGVKDGFNISERIERLELRINDLKSSDVYKTLAKSHVANVTSPIKKTNVILKNVNFQYALNLWNYLQEHIQDENKRKKENKNYEDNGELKSYFDENSLLNYLALSTLNNSSSDLNLTEEEVEKITNQLIDQIVSINSNMEIEQLEQMIGNKIVVAKNRNIASLNEIKNVFSKNIDKYLEKIKDFNWR